jgi:hypothetical protein
MQKSFWQSAHLPHGCSCRRAVTIQSRTDFETGATFSALGSKQKTKAGKN